MTQDWHATYALESVQRRIDVLSSRITSRRVYARRKRCLICEQRIGDRPGRVCQRCVANPPSVSVRRALHSMAHASAPTRIAVPVGAVTTNLPGRKREVKCRM